MGENGEFSEADFEACFKEFDKDGNGTISKDEMKIFIKKVAGLWRPHSALEYFNFIKNLHLILLLFFVLVIFR